MAQSPVENTFLANPFRKTLALLGCTSLAALGVALASHAPAQAQGWYGYRDRGYTYYEPAPVFTPPPYYRGGPDYPPPVYRRPLRGSSLDPDRGPRALLPGDVRALVARRGMRLVGPLQRNGRVFLADVRTRSGQPLRLVIDGYYGIVLQTFAGTGPGVGPQRSAVPRPPANIGRRVARVPDRPDRFIDVEPEGGALPPGAPAVIPGLAPPLLQAAPSERVPPRTKTNSRKKTAARTPRPVARPAALDSQPAAAPPVAAPALPAALAPEPVPVEPRAPAQAAAPAPAVGPAVEPAPAVPDRAPPLMATPPVAVGEPAVRPPREPARAAIPEAAAKPEVPAVKRKVTPAIPALSDEPPQTVEPLTAPQASRSAPVEPPAPPAVTAPVPQKGSAVAPGLVPLPPQAPVSIPITPEDANLKRLRNSRVVYPGVPPRPVQGGVAPLDAPPVKSEMPVPVAPLN